MCFEICNIYLIIYLTNSSSRDRKISEASYRYYLMPRIIQSRFNVLVRLILRSLVYTIIILSCNNKFIFYSKQFPVNVYVHAELKVHLTLIKSSPT